jgi:tol-pal system protein YbgF
VNGRRALSMFVALLALAVTGGCASGSLPGSGGRGEDLAEVKARVLELQRQAAVNELELARLRQQVAELEARVGGAPTARPAISEQRRAPPPAAPTERRGLETSPPPPTREEDDLEPDFPAPRQVPPSPPPPPATSLPAPALPPSDASPVAAGPLPPVPRAGQAIYDQGYTLYHQGRHLEAEARFEEFLDQHPATELSDNAQYWIGSARFARGDYAGALEAFRRTVERYPRENKVPDALFKVGQCLEELGDPRGAVEIYRELARRFPDTAAAALAAERLSPSSDS